MALIVHLKYLENLKRRSEKVAKVTFRGNSHVTKTAENMDSSLMFNEVFKWPVARPIEADEAVIIELYTYNKYVSNRLLGTFKMVLQELIEVGNIHISDCMLDNHNTVTKMKVTFELTYHAPDGSLDVWREGCLQYPDSDALRITLEGEPLEHGLDQMSFGSMNDMSGTPSLYSSISRSSLLLSDQKSLNVSTQSLASLSSNKSTKSLGKRTIKQVLKLAKFMRPKHSRREVDDYKLALTGYDNMAADSSDMDDRAIEVAAMLAHTLNDQYESAYADGPASQSGGPLSKRSNSALKGEESLMKVQDFQVCVTIVEARQLAGLSIDPTICVQVGDHKKYTSVKESTNCPYYNEYFVFDFHLAPLMLFDKIIKLTVLHSRNFVRKGTVVGSYKFDIASVYRMPDHQFYHKWAILTDPDDFSGGVKGYLRCDIAVLGNGDSIKAPPKSTKEDDDDIEANLLLPDGVSVDRQMARYVVIVYKAEGLPKMNTGIIANVKKVIMGDITDLVDPYVEVNFCGHKEKTSVIKSCYEPVWNEQVVFTEMFPPLCRRIRVQLRDSNSVNDEIIGTYFLDLSCVSNEGEKGFMPTYGPAWVNLYGSTRVYRMMSKDGHLNDGVGEGVSFRGRLLIALQTEIIGIEDNGAAAVEVESALPISEAAAGREEEYFLFGTFFEATMIDRKVGDKPIHFEISIGNAGNVLDGYNAPNQQSTAPKSDKYSSGTSQANEDQTPKMESPQWVSVTPATKAVSKDGHYYHLPFYEDKPCVYVREMFEDHRRRLYNPNIIHKICDKLEEGLNEVHHMVEEQQPFIEQRLMAVLDKLDQSCSRCVSLVKGTGGGSAAGKTRLDQERHNLLISEMNHVCHFVKNMTTEKKSNWKENIKTVSHFVTKLRSLALEPQHAVPDVFIWMVTNNRRIAYQRIPAQDIIYSIVDEEKGKHCGRPMTIFLKLPGNKAMETAGWAIQAKLQVLLWLGLLKHKKDFLKGLPRGYEETKLLKQASSQTGAPPLSIKYKECQLFQLRAHIYQARQLIGSDDSGLSDPFARIAVCHQSAATQVIDETLSPIWNEMLVLDNVEIYGQAEQITDNCPVIVVEVFDQDKTGKPEFIGRALCKPVVKMSTESYSAPKFPPCLEWWDIHRGSDRAGELLATFELLQKPFEESDLKAAYETPPSSRKSTSTVSHVADVPSPKMPLLSFSFMKDRGPILSVPKGIRPVLGKYQIQVLFWGVRHLKRLHLQAVGHPRIDIECAGSLLSSTMIANIKKNPNFDEPVKHFDVELPENELFCPPITIRCVDCRSFGRYTLVGTHVIGNLHKFKHAPSTTLAQNEPQKVPLQGSDNLKKEEPITPASPGDLAIPLNNNPPPTETQHSVTIDLGTQVSATKTETTKENKKDSAAEEEPDIDVLDWWSKYFASLELVNKQEQCEDIPNEEQFAGNNMNPGNRVEYNRNKTSQGANKTSPGDDSGLDVDFKQVKNQDKKPTKQANKQKPAKGLMKFTNLISQLSPKSVKKDKPMAKATPLKVFCKKVFKQDKSQETIVEPIETFMIYPSELESVAEFHGFKDWLHTFELYRGKNTGNGELKENRVVGKFKGSMKILKLPLDQSVDEPMVGDPTYGLFQWLPSSEPVQILVRVYVVKANDLHPADLNGKADPYLVVKLGSTTFNDKEKYVSKQLSPVFGRCFEFEVTFPMESTLTVQVFDWDLIGSDDLIGETKVDLENRYYSRHRATCGMSMKYEIHGYNAWRDSQKPTQILAKLCKDERIDAPQYQSGKVRVGEKTFVAPVEIEDENGVKRATNEHLALTVLKNWAQIPGAGCCLVPEHVETRPLYNPEKPGIEQGKIEMFVDMFPMDMPPPGPPIDISPRKPKSYELRCIIWNTDNVILEDTAALTGEQMSDIYVKGWIKGGDDVQATDIHYRSLTGEGNFNWRFVFPFDYLVAEEKIVITRKESIFSWDETESKIPPRLNLQVWDADHFSADDFLGSLNLDLNNFPRGAKTARKCNMNMVKADSSVRQMSLFKVKRVKGWWPFLSKNEITQELQITGKVEAELHLVTAEEAEKSPVGLGRSEPEPLDKPNRPDTSFMWFMNPLKSLRYIIWHNYKWLFLKLLLIAFIVFMVILFFYSMPGYTVKKIFGV